MVFWITVLKTAEVFTKPYVCYHVFNNRGLMICDMCGKDTDPTDVYRFCKSVFCRHCYLHRYTPLLRRP